jgi:CxxC motif-containing protein (DUF1111 family)
MAKVKIANGRPKKSEVGKSSLYKNFSALAKRNSERAFMVILSLLDSEDPKIQLQAAESVLNRAWGKPKIEIDQNVQLSADGLADELAKARMRELALEKKEHYRLINDAAVDAVLVDMEEDESD